MTLVLLVVFFWTPLHKLSAALPDALANSETVTVGSLSLRVRRRLSTQANQEVREALSAMSVADVTLVLENPMEVSQGNHLAYNGISSELLDRWVKLEQLGMVTRVPDAELALQANISNRPKAIFGITPTAKYYKVRNFLINVLGDVVTGGVRESQPDRSGT